MWNSLLRCSGIASVNEGLHSLTCHPHVHPQVEWAMPAFFPSCWASPDFSQYSFPIQPRVGGWVGLVVAAVADNQTRDHRVASPICSTASQWYLTLLTKSMMLFVGWANEELVNISANKWYLSLHSYSALGQSANREPCRKRRAGFGQTPSCHPTNSVKASKETQSNDVDHGKSTTDPHLFIIHQLTTQVGTTDWLS